MDGRFTVFDFGEVDFVVFGADNINFIKVGFVVSRDDGVTFGFQVFCDELFGLLAG